MIPAPAPLILLRAYQRVVFDDHATKTLLIHWSRQIGKSFTIANWAVARLLKYPGRCVTVLSNSRANGEELVLKCHEVAQKLRQAMQAEAVECHSNNAALDARADLDEDAKFRLMSAAVHITVKGQRGRIIVLAANPDTARGFSGDLILDEFAFHKDSKKIWEAASPIISSNRDFLCRILSTGNGKLNMFYQLIADGRIPYYRVRRSDAHASGELKIYSEVDNREITPAQAREEATDKAAYDQNYECTFNDEASALLTTDLVAHAQDLSLPAPEEDAWSEAACNRVATYCEARPGAALFAGVDVARTRDYTVLAVLAREGASLAAIAILRMRNTRLPEQKRQLGRILNCRTVGKCCIDMTGIGTGLVEFAQDEPAYGRKVEGVHFSSREPVSRRLAAQGHRTHVGAKAVQAKVTEIMATDLLGAFEDRRITIPADTLLRDDLRKPERLTSPTGQVSIAAARDASGHADHFWALALAVRAASRGPGPAYAQAVPRAGYGPGPLSRHSTTATRLGAMLGVGRANRANRRAF